MKVRVTPRYENSAEWNCANFGIVEGSLALLNDEEEVFMAWGPGFWVDVQVTER